MRKFNVNVNGKMYYVEIEETDAPASTAVVPPAPAPVQAAAPVVKAKAEAGSTVVASPMPGQILNILVSDGATVKKGDKIIVLEAMKMENEIVASADGVVTFLVKKGDSVDTGAQLAFIK